MFLLDPVSTNPPPPAAEPYAEIVGASERFLLSGSSIELVCLIKDAVKAPFYVFWYHRNELINYDR